jgi:serine-type D-Ala-D-Ala carboxypeptidase (penicillin-binding protein 5/6)
MATHSADAAKKVRKSKGCSPAFSHTSLVVDGHTGKILHSEKAHLKVDPASITKLMTLYLVFEAVESGKLRLDQKLYVSKNAAKMKPSKLGLTAGEKISVYDVILAMIVKSANDATLTAAEAISGSEKNFTKLMTLRAHQLGMKDSIFKTASGYDHNKNLTTSMDIAKLAMALKRDYRKFYHLFSYTKFNFRGVEVHGHNRVTANYDGAEGLKTGFTCPAGFNLVTTASRGNKSLIGVVTGSTSAASRDQKMVSLLDKHFKTTQPKPMRVAFNNKPRRKTVSALR